MYILIGFTIIVIILFLPRLFRKKSFRMEGPDLAELDFSEVFFDNSEIHLSGMIFRPGGDGPFPAVVMIHGSGTSRRNSPWYLTLAKHLQANGIAVLLPDKRGSEKSGGDWKQATFRDLAGDVSAAVNCLKIQTEFQPTSIGVMGFSQGGWIAPIVASENEAVAFVVSLSGAGVTTDEQLLHEEVNTIAGFGTYRFVARLIAPLTLKKIKQAGWWKLMAGFDPLPYWRKVTIPVFMAFGEGDKNVPVEASVTRIKALNQGNIAYKVYPAGGHGILDPVTHQVQNGLLHDVLNFIQEVQQTRERRK